MSESGVGAILAGVVVVLLVVCAIALVISIVVMIAQWKLFTKAGEPGWGALIPVYNLFVMNKIAFGNYRWAIAYVIVWGLDALISGMRVVFQQNEYLQYIGLILALIAMPLSIAMTVINAVTMFHFSKAYGKSTAWNVLMIIFTPIMMVILAFDKTAEYVGPSDFGQDWADTICEKLNIGKKNSDSTASYTSYTAPNTSYDNNAYSNGYTAPSAPAEMTPVEPVQEAPAYTAAPVDEVSAAPVDETSAAPVDDTNVQ